MKFVQYFLRLLTLRFERIRMAIAAITDRALELPLFLLHSVGSRAVAVPCRVPLDDSPSEAEGNHRSSR
ncbi:MAG: hypothetical protein ACHQNE_08165, partial [Candidatus Kapaibacterium sp.]